MRTTTNNYSMKKLLLLMSLSILLQSCFSYKAVDYKRNAIQISQEVKVQTNNQESYKGRFVSVNEDEISIISNTNGQQIAIPHASILYVGTKSFSALKTLGFTAGTTFALLVLALSSADLN